MRPPLAIILWRWRRLQYRTQEELTDAEPWYIGSRGHGAIMDRRRLRICDLGLLSRTCCGLSLMWVWTVLAVETRDLSWPPRLLDSEGRNGGSNVSLVVGFEVPDAISLNRCVG